MNEQAPEPPPPGETGSSGNLPADLEPALNALSAGLLDISPYGRVWALNDAAKPLLSPAGLADLEACAPIQAAMRGQRVEKLEVQLCGNWWRISAFPRTSPDGTPGGMLVAAEPVSPGAGGWKQLEAVMASASEGMAIAQPDGRIVRINPAALQLLGYPDPAPAELWLSTLSDAFDIFLVDGTPVHPQEGALERSLRGERLRNVALRFRRRDTGAERLVSYSTAPILDEQGNVQFGVLALREVTGQKVGDQERLTLHQRERAARDEAEDAWRWYQRLTDSLPQIIWSAKPNGELDFLNRRWQEYTGMEPERLRHDWLTVIHPEDTNRCANAWLEGCAGAQPWEMEARLRRAPDLTYRWHLVRGVPILDAEGRLVKFCGTSTDIHEQKETERRLAEALAALQRTEFRMRRIADSNVAGVCFWRDEGLIVEANDEYLRLVGMTRADLEAGLVNWRQYIAPEYLAIGEAALAELRKRGSTPPFEKVYQHSNGKRVPVLMGIAALDTQGREGVAFAVDLTDLKAAERALKESNQDLQQFAFVASHDMQEPLRMVTSYAQLLLRKYGPALEPEAIDYLAFVIDGAKRMSGLIEGLLAFSRLGFGQTNPPVETELSTVVDWALMNLQVAIHENGASISYSGLPAVSVDQTQMVQLFQNLIGNALKYRSQEAPVIRIGATRKGDDWEIAVSDNGIGFDPKYGEQIFGLFKRLHGRKYDGTGLGLAICRRIVERHGGRIWAEGIPGKGATFFFTLPAES